MQRRHLANGTTIARARSPHGVGHVYYVDGGPEGVVQVIDTFMVGEAVIAACLAWELDDARPDGPHPAPVFNRAGFRF